MDVLVYLAACPGEVCSKEAMLEAIWDGACVEEGVLAQAIHSLRKALGDNARKPRFIQTIPKRGYRLVAPVVRMQIEQELPEGNVPLVAPLWHWKQWLFVDGLRGFLFIIGICLLLALIPAFIEPRPRSLRGKTASTNPLFFTGHRIAVLPFDDLGSPEVEVTAFSRGLTEEITKDLGSLTTLKVVSHNSIMHSGRQKSLSEIARELNVNYILEGTVQWDVGNDRQPRVRIRPRLTRTTDYRVIWTRNFDREIEDILAVQSEVSIRISERLGVVASSQTREAALDALYRAKPRRPTYPIEYLFEIVLMFGRAPINQSFSRINSSDWRWLQQHERPSA